jgi:hypothetical protein
MADFSFVGRSAYTAPASTALNFSFSTAPLAVTGVGAVTLEFIPAGAGTVTPPTYTGTGAVDLAFTPAADARHGITGEGAATLSFTPAGAGMHPRYELRGQVLDGGTLVDRRVRAYRRSTGALAHEVDTVAGQFTIAAGFALDEFYLVPIDLSSTAEDWAPPVANRVLSVLKVD